MTESGPGLDAAGNPVWDPTRNVLRLVEAEGRRQDEVRAAEARRVDDLRMLNDEHLRELINVRADANQRLIESNERLINVRADYETQLRIAAVKQAEALAGQLATVQETFPDDDGHPVRPGGPADGRDA